MFLSLIGSMFLTGCFTKRYCIGELGGNLSTITYDDEEASDYIDPVFGKDLGFACRFEFDDNEDVIFQPGIYYSVYGEKYSYSFNQGGTSYDYEQIFKSRNLVVPVLFGYRISDEFSISAGPEVDFVLSGKSTFNENGMESEYKGTDGLNTLGAGINLRADYQINDRFNVALRYNKGLTNVFEGSADDDGYGKHSVFTLKLGYIIDAGDIKDFFGM